MGRILEVVMWLFVMGVMAALATVITSRSMRERSLQSLSTDQKAQLVDSFSKNRVVMPAIMAGIVALYVVLVAAGIRGAATMIVVGLPSLSLLAWSHVAVVRRLRNLGMPESYIQTFSRSRLLGYAGLLTLLVTWVLTLWQNQQ